MTTSLHFDYTCHRYYIQAHFEHDLHHTIMKWLAGVGCSFNVRLRGANALYYLGKFTREFYCAIIKRFGDPIGLDDDSPITPVEPTLITPTPTDEPPTLSPLLTEYLYEGKFFRVGLVEHDPMYWFQDHAFEKCYKFDLQVLIDGQWTNQLAVLDDSFWNNLDNQIKDEIKTGLSKLKESKDSLERSKIHARFSSNVEDYRDSILFHDNFLTNSLKEIGVVGYDHEDFREVRNDHYYNYIHLDTNVERSLLYQLVRDAARGHDEDELEHIYLYDFTDADWDYLGTVLSHANEMKANVASGDDDLIGLVTDDLFIHYRDLLFNNIVR